MEQSRSSTRQNTRRQSTLRPDGRSDICMSVLSEHPCLTTDSFQDLFARIGTVSDAKLTYDRAGRSEGIAFVTYDRIADAREAIREFDGANAKGQPIRLTLLPLPPRASAPARRDNPFDRVTNPRSLFDRIEAPAARERRRTDSPLSEGDEYGRNGSRRAPRNDRRSNVSRPAPENIDRYVPGQRASRDNSRRGGRRPGERREKKPDAAPRSAGRPKKTAEELDAEMEDYWGAQSNAPGENAPQATAAPAATTEAVDDIDMIE